MSNPTTMSIDGVVALVGSEAIVPFRYKDSVNVDTLGIGHTKNAGGFNPSSIPYGKEQELELVFSIFQRDLKKFEKRVVKANGNAPTKQHQFDAQVHWDFNTGGIHKATWMESHRKGLYATAAQQILNWSKPPEIMGRRQKEKALYERGIYPDHKASVYPADRNGRILWNSGKKLNIRPIAESIFAANESDKQADADRNKTVASGGTGAVAGGTEVSQVGAPTEIPDVPTSTPIPDLPVDMSPDILSIVLTIVVIGGLVLAGYYGISYLRAKRKRNDAIKQATRVAQRSLMETQNGDSDNDSFTGHTSSLTDSD